MMLRATRERANNCSFWLCSFKVLLAVSVKGNMSRRSTNPRCELHVVEQLRHSPRSEHQVENTVKNYARRNRQTKFHSQLKTAVC